VANLAKKRRLINNGNQFNKTKIHKKMVIEDDEEDEGGDEVEHATVNHLEIIKECRKMLANVTLPFNTSSSQTKTIENVICELDSAYEKCVSFSSITDPEQVPQLFQLIRKQAELISKQHEFNVSSSKTFSAIRKSLKKYTATTTTTTTS
jgi:hypothetical protein